MPHVFEIIEPPSSILIDKCQIKVTKLENIITLPSSFLHNTNVSTAHSSLDDNHIIS